MSPGLLVCFLWEALYRKWPAAMFETGLEGGKHEGEEIYEGSGSAVVLEASASF